MADGSFQVPKWAGKAPLGTHADVRKEDQLLQVSCKRGTAPRGLTLPNPRYRS